MIGRVLALLPALAALAAAPPAPQSADSSGVCWAKSWEDAKTEALERNVPILFTIQQDNNPACKEMEKTFRTEGFIKESRQVVCVVASVDDKHGADPKTKICKAYGANPCEAHVECHNGGMAALIKQGSIDIPMQIWCKHDGTQISEFKGPIAQDAPSLIADLKRALARIDGPHMDYKTWALHRQMIRDGEDAQLKFDYKKALATFKKLAASTSEWFSIRGKQLTDRLVRTCIEVVNDALKQYEKAPGEDPKAVAERKDARQKVQKIAKDMKGTEAGDEAEKALKGMK